MRMETRYKMILPVAIGGLMLAACGGGGGGGGSTALTPADVGYSGPTTGVEITTSTADSVATETLANALGLDLSGTTSSLMKVGGASKTGLPGLAGYTQQLMDRNLAQAPTHSKVLAGVTQTSTYYCSDDSTGGHGTIIYSADVADPNASTPSAGDSYSMSANNCNESGLTLSGGFSFVVNSYSSSSHSTKVTYSNLKITQDSTGDYLLFNGAFTMAFGENGGTITASLTGDALMVEARTNGTVAMEAMSKFSFVDTLDSSLNMTLDHDYTFLSTVSGGAVTVTTTDPFLVYYGDSYPSSGQLVITGKNGASIRITAQASVVQIEYDLDGNGTYGDNTDPAPKTVAWTAL